MDKINKKRITKLLNKEAVREREKELVKDFKGYAEYNGELTPKQEMTLKRIYHKYFINSSEASKNNRNLDDF